MIEKKPPCRRRGITVREAKDSEQTFVKIEVDNLLHPILVEQSEDEKGEDEKGWKNGDNNTKVIRYVVEKDGTYRWVATDAIC